VSLLVGAWQSDVDGMLTRQCSTATLRLVNSSTHCMRCQTKMAVWHLAHRGLSRTRAVRPLGCLQPCG